MLSDVAGLSDLGVVSLADMEAFMSAARLAFAKTTVDGLNLASEPICRVGSDGKRTGIGVDGIVTLITLVFDKLIQCRQINNDPQRLQNFANSRTAQGVAERQAARELRRQEKRARAVERQTGWPADPEQFRVEEESVSRLVASGLEKIRNSDDKQLAALCG
jgi:hypothetical protein